MPYNISIAMAKKMGVFKTKGKTRVGRKRGPSHLEAEMALQFIANDMAQPIAQYRLFAEIVGKGKGVREQLRQRPEGWNDFKYDFAWPEHKLLFEVNGGTWMKGKSGHTSGKSYLRDCKKREDAQLLGWQVYTCDSSMVKSGRALETIIKLLER